MRVRFKGGANRELMLIGGTLYGSTVEGLVMERDLPRGLFNLLHRWSAVLLHGSVVKRLLNGDRERMKGNEEADCVLGVMALCAQFLCKDGAISEEYIDI